MTPERRDVSHAALISRRTLLGAGGALAVRSSRRSQELRRRPRPWASRQARSRIGRAITVRRHHRSRTWIPMSSRSTPVQQPAAGEHADPATLDGALWSEGPAWSGQGRYLVWSDIPNNRQLRWLEDDNKVSNQRLFSDFMIDGIKCGPDGVRCDVDGNLWVSSNGNPGGRALGYRASPTGHRRASSSVEFGCRRSVRTSDSAVRSGIASSCAAASRSTRSTSRRRAQRRRER